LPRRCSWRRLSCRAAPRAAAPQDRPAARRGRQHARVFTEIQETKDIQARIRQDEQRLNAEGKTKADEFAEDEGRGRQLPPGSEQYEDWRTRFMRVSIQNQAWAEMAKQGDRLAGQAAEPRHVRQDRRSRQRVRHGNQLDLVLADHQPPLSDAELEKIPTDQIGVVMDRRRIIYASKYADISDAIIASLDAKYKGRRRPGAPSARPRPTALRPSSATPRRRQGPASRPRRAPPPRQRQTARAPREQPLKPLVDARDVMTNDQIPHDQQMTKSR
jgi:hypothetical protein